ncbi:MULTISPECIES: GDYXXLXY domain-containing protein [unclassified Nodularia (in: cyanobacteria)]|uniref:GDYXXLXY domain-containing protein n=1 Tax=unclassified Nodularia (in: cyanobacteria) TaxID=2656917 RepID=UPI001880E169|nr:MULTISPECIES: GDYXXLXY domain-containing protein [unclassified Nodularia (in: cyanobacteria)]MBE9199626.1 GDYXXLXY domain-containing protein [Nodularia sp. LEGE 06071]MCC2695726.1 GDYXXLXY domain-containing protein [Nodularia sp. LEGE 04288]
MSSDSSESSGNKSSKTLSPEAEFSEKLTFRDYLIATEQKANQPLPFWRLLVPLLIQTGIILAVPTQAMYTNIAGRDVILQTVAQDPNNVVQDFALSLEYNISRVENLRRLSGWDNLLRSNQGRNRQLQSGTNLYVILQEQQIASGRGVPIAWRPIRVSNNLPESLPSNQVALRGVYQDNAITYGIETYYLPEQQRQQISSDIFQTVQQTRGNRGRQIRPITVRVKVDPQGNAVPVSLWVRDASNGRSYRNYSF